MPSELPSDGWARNCIQLAVMIKDRGAERWLVDLMNLASHSYSTRKREMYNLGDLRQTSVTRKHVGYVWPEYTVTQTAVYDVRRVLLITTVLCCARRPIFGRLWLAAEFCA